MLQIPLPHKDVKNIFTVMLVFLTIWIIWMFIVTDKKETKYVEQNNSMQLVNIKHINNSRDLQQLVNIKHINKSRDLQQLVNIKHINKSRDLQHFDSSEKDSNIKLLNAVEVIQRMNRTVLITLINEAYLPFAYSWLCNTIKMDIHKQVMFITTDSGSENKLNSDWPDVKVVYWPGTSSDGEQEYSHAGYVKLMILRSKILLILVEKNVEIFLFEVDCLWMRNPVPILRQMKGVDLCVCPVSERSNQIAGGFLYIFPTNKTKILWRELTNKLLTLSKTIKRVPDKNAISENDNDQIYLSKLVRTKYGGIEVMTLKLSEFADGKWYKQNAEQRRLSHPYVINNNWILGNKAKINRAKKWHHWFIHDDLSCDYEALDNLT